MPGTFDDLAAQVHGQLLGHPSAGSGGEDEILALVRQAAPLLPSDAVRDVVREVADRLHGLGPLDALLRDDQVADVLINGPGRVWVERSGRLQQTELVLDAPTIALLIERILGPLGRQVDPVRPIAEARLPGGSRVQVLVPPISVDGPCLAIRRFATRSLPIEAFASEPVVALLRWMVVARWNVVVVGPTGAGKTTVLNALAGLIDPGQRLVTVEDAAELRLPLPHVVRLESRPDTSAGTSPITCRDLVRAALRLRPDRLIIGEVRGAEALDMVQAMSTGHDGSLSTLHANDCADALRRLEMLVLLAGSGLPHAAVREQLGAAVDAVIAVERGVGGDRRITGIVEVAPPELGGTGRAPRVLVAAGAVRARPARPARSSAAGDPPPADAHRASP